MKACFYNYTSKFSCALMLRSSRASCQPLQLHRWSTSLLSEFFSWFKKSTNSDLSDFSPVLSEYL